MVFSNRYSPVLDEPGAECKVQEVRNGSVELIILVSGLVAAVVIPFVAIAVQRELARRDQRVHFEISPQDLELKRILDDYEQRKLGKGDGGLQVLMHLLQGAGYDISFIQENAYLIGDVSGRYARRIVRTMYRNR